MNKLFIGSKNYGKIKEIKSVLNNLNIEILSCYNFKKLKDISETGKTYRENALLKAKAFYDEVKIPVIADDSGLEIESLNNQPGLFSARYAGENASDKENIEKLLNQLNNIKTTNKSARFICIIVYYDGKIEKYFEGVCNGIISELPKGDKGFGYDPIFIPEGYNITFAQMGELLKNNISHRGKALKKLKKYLIKLK